MLSSRSLNGLRALLVATPVASAVAVAVLLLRVRSHGSVHAELFALSLLEVGAPVVPLALLPRASRRAGGGFGGRDGDTDLGQSRPMDGASDHTQTITGANMGGCGRGERKTLNANVSCGYAL